METAMSNVYEAAAKAPETAGWVDTMLHHEYSTSGDKPSADDILQDIEQEYLQPSRRFNDSWLNKLQQRWDVPFDHFDLVRLAPTQSRTVTRFTREGLQGRVSGYRQVTVPAGSATAKNSTSLLRKPASRATFVRGGSGYMPFAPGGLDGIEAVAAHEDQLLREDEATRSRKPRSLDRVLDIGPDGGLLEVPPGFSRGLDFRKLDAKKAAAAAEGAKEAEQVRQLLEEEPAADVVPSGDSDGNEMKQSNEQEDETESHGEEDEMDALLPVEFPSLAAHATLRASSARKPGREWAHMVDVNRPFDNFRELVPEMAREWPFELDTFQKEAVYHLENGDSVFVAAHTSAGKTVVAEYAIALAAKHMTKAIYTSPIKALSNQKFRDFRQTFDDVGVLTGDVQINPEASCLIMTTEILRSMLYRGADLIRDVEYVIFDEVHYVNDLERGVVWEEVIIMLPEYVTLILLSATVPNTKEFASWVGRTKKKDIYVISTPKRPVPLQHFLWSNKGTHLIVDADKKFQEKGWKDANDSLSGRDKLEAKLAIRGGSSTATGSARGGAARGQQQRGGQAPRGQQRGGGQRGGQRGGPVQRGQGNVGRTGRGGGRTTAAQDRTLWVNLVQHLKKHDLLPTCIFVFSKKRCEENADSLSNLDFCNASEKSAIHMILGKSLARLKAEDRNLPQIIRIRDLLSRGIAVHHGGLLPIVKEVVELLFARTLVKVLFATETFAMGLNLPTRTVVFSGYRKHDGRSFRDLLPGEYTQMAGRAGRRGLDPVGSVIIVAPGAEEAPPAATLRNMILGDPTKLRSQFRLTYNMILNLLRVEALKIEEMIKRSFSENAAQALLPEHERAIKLSEADLDKLKRDGCSYCDVDLEQIHKASMAYKEHNSSAYFSLLSSPSGRRLFSARRLIVHHRDGIRTAGILMKDGVTGGSIMQVLEFAASEPQRKDSDLLPYLSSLRHLYKQLPSRKSELRLRVASVSISDLECLTQTFLRIDATEVLKPRSTSLEQAYEDIFAVTDSWTLPAWDEVDLSRVKEISVREALAERAKAAASIVETDSQSLKCPDFVHHYAQRHDEWLIKENITQLKSLMSDQNLQLLPDYNQRVEVLKELGFVSSDGRVELKGKVACEIHNADELVLTELILENVLKDYSPEEIVALLSSFVFQEKTDAEPRLTPALERGVAKIVEISERVNHVQTLHQVILSADDSNDFVSRPRFGLTEVVYEWARGMSFNRITDLTDVLEGTIVRVITRLDEACRDVKNAARIVGDPDLFQKMATCQELIRRDICATASLYM